MRCFISHPWANHIHHFALRLTRELRELGVDVWIDQEQMEPGQTIMTRQLNGIQYETDIFIFVLAIATLQSDNCMEELKTASRIGKPIITIILERCEIPEFLSKSITVDFTNPIYFDASVARLLAGAEKLYRLHKVTDILNDDNPENRSEAARILGDTHDPRMLKPILTRIEVEQDETVKYWLITALGDLIEPNQEEGKIAMQLLNKSAKTETRFVQRGVAVALQKLRSRYPDSGVDQ